jgi:hypothetical protein
VNTDETAMIIRAVKALCPAQKFDEFTPDLWEDVLADTDFADARTAIIVLRRSEPFIGPSEIATDVRRMRNERIARLPQPCPNPVDGVSERDELIAIRRAIADGAITTVAEVYAYERWGGSLHLALQAGQLPQLAGPAPEGGQPVQITAFQRIPR